MNIDIGHLTKFLDKANKHTYAADGARAKSTRLASQDFEYKNGDLVYHDTYFGNKYFIGEEIVYQNKKPVWGLNYYGHALNSDFALKNIYAFLKEALLQDCQNIIPVRGPASFKRGLLKYKNRVKGGLTDFEGKEQIFNAGRLVYQAAYQGGLIE